MASYGILPMLRYWDGFEPFAESIDILKLNYCINNESQSLKQFEQKAGLGNCSLVFCVNRLFFDKKDRIALLLFLKERLLFLLILEICNWLSFFFCHPNWYDSARKMRDSLLKRANRSLGKSEQLLWLKKTKQRSAHFAPAALSVKNDKSDSLPSLLKLRVTRAIRSHCSFLKE